MAESPIMTSSMYIHTMLQSIPFDMAGLRWFMNAGADKACFDFFQREE